MDQPTNTGQQPNTGLIPHQQGGYVDPHPGFYYVSMVDGDRYWLLSGPYRMHQFAIDAVKIAKWTAQQHDPRTAFYAFGTCHTETDAGPGRLNKAGLLLMLKADQPRGETA